MSGAADTLKARRVYLALHNRIMSGAVGRGARLPGEPALAAEHGVARVTVRRALDRLAHDGLIERRPGAGTFVRAPARPAASGDVFDSLKEMGRRTEVRVLAFGYLVPPPPIAAALELPEGEPAQHAVRIRRTAGGPFSHLTTFVPLRIARDWGAEDLARLPLLALLERSGVRIGTARQTIGATLAGPDIAAALKVEVGAPLIALTRLVRDADDRPVEHLHALYRPDRFSFEMSLQRTGNDGARRWVPLPPGPGHSGEQGIPTT